MTRNAPAWIGLSVLFAAAAYLATLGIHARDAEVDAGAQLASALALLIVVGGAAGFGYRPRAHMALRQGLAWLAIGLTGAIIYVHRAAFDDVGGRLLADLFQVRLVAHEAGAKPEVAARAGEAAISAGRGGHFFVEAMINGTHVRLVADTGATVVALTSEDAARIGLDPADLNFIHRQRTANGIALAAPVILDEVNIGPIALRNVAASVSQPGMLSDNLLGMSFLSRLSSFQVRGDQLILRQ